ncbi:UNVERIFIED_CONTAM: hypothetical protein FKN15_036873 [Acipenser sinensis]
MGSIGKYREADRDAMPFHVRVIEFGYCSSVPFLAGRLPPTHGNKLSCLLVQGNLCPLPSALTGQEGDLTPSVIRSLSQFLTTKAQKSVTMQYESLATHREAQTAKMETKIRVCTLHDNTQTKTQDKE